MQACSASLRKMQEDFQWGRGMPPTRCVKIILHKRTEIWCAVWEQFSRKWRQFASLNAVCTLYAKPRKALSSKAFRRIVDLASGDVVQLVRTLPCHGRGRGFESRRPRQFFQALARNWQFRSWSNLVQLGQCFSLVEYHPNKFALCQSLVRHSRLSVKIQRYATVGMT